MQLPIYAQAVSELAVPKLNKFIKDMGEAGHTLDLPNWSKAKASEKREMLMAALQADTELRKEFVPFYDAETGNENDWSEWETADLPTEDAAPEPAADIVPAVATDAPASAPEFVEGAFHQMVSDVAGMSGEDAEHNLRSSENTQEFEHLRQGVLLSHIQSTQYYAVAGFDNMRGYLADRFPTMHYRKAMQLITNANVITELGIADDELKGVSWAALRHIVGIMDAENYKHWLDAARSTTHLSLIEAVKEHKATAAGALPKPENGDDAPTTPALETKTFSLYPEQKESINAAIEKAKVEGNTDSTGAALDLIAASFTGKPPSDASLSSVMPDLSAEGFTKMFSKLNADHGMADALAIVFEAVEAIWPDVDIHVELPEQNATAAE